MPERAPLHFPTTWTHFVIAASLSPRARSSALSDATDALSALSRLTRAAGAPRLTAERLPPALVTLPLLDLGPCPRAAEGPLRLTLRRAARARQSFKVMPQGWDLGAAGAAGAAGAEEAPGAPLSLSLRDRDGQLAALSAELAATLARYGFDAAPLHTPLIPLAALKREEGRGGARGDDAAPSAPSAPSALSALAPHLPPPQRTPIWIHELVLLRRPHAYAPREGYEVACAATLLVPREGDAAPPEQKETHLAQESDSSHEEDPAACSLPAGGERPDQERPDQERPTPLHDLDARSRQLRSALEERLSARSRLLPRAPHTSTPFHPLSPL
ncbi:MAG: hypothetical protein FJ138_16725, partial [Deltaproteobacteria bacterium]|nr:hypothetical protein [Deltaproteobacteria bacterium]